VRADLRELIGVLVPSLAVALELRSRRDVHTLQIPEEIFLELTAAFNLHPSCSAGGSPSLRDMADGFVMSYDHSTIRFRPGLTVEQKKPPIFEYLSLLKCQFLMQRMRASNELHNAPKLSHWPGYVDTLEEVIRNGA
jgi:hypothetical protein